MHGFEKQDVFRFFENVFARGQGSGDGPGLTACNGTVSGVFQIWSANFSRGDITRHARDGRVINRMNRHAVFEDEPGCLNTSNGFCDRG